MRILLVHNFYQQPGGEDKVFFAEKKILEENGHQVETFTKHNDVIKGLKGKLLGFVSTIYNPWIQREFEAQLKTFQPEVIHIHNTFPLISSAILRSAKKYKIPVIATIHNFRHICPSALLLRENKICELCITKPFALPAIAYRCYKNSFIGSIALALSNYLNHHVLKIWVKHTHQFIFLTEFTQQKFLESKIKFKPEQLTIKPNFIEDTGFSTNKKNYYLFIGRLSPEKGLLNILKPEIWQNRELVICGDGPLKSQVELFCKNNPNVQYQGQLQTDKLYPLLASAKALVFPSIWYEGQPLTIIESLMKATPVIHTNLGGVQSTLRGCAKKLGFDAQNPSQIMQCFTFIEALTPETFEALCQQHRNIYQAHFSKAQNLPQLEAIYKKAILTNNL